MGRFYIHQQTVADGPCVIATLRGGSVERHEFATSKEAEARAALITEGLSWLGTPFRDCADVKGPSGAVDCAMMLCRSFVDTGNAAPFDPRPYSPRHMLHSDEQKFLGWIEKLGGIEVATPRIGDVVVWQFGRSFCHGGLLINSREVVHAYSADGMATVSGLDAPLLREITRNLARPVKYFDCWKKT